MSGAVKLRRTVPAVLALLLLLAACGDGSEDAASGDAAVAPVAVNPEGQPASAQPEGMLALGSAAANIQGAGASSQRSAQIGWQTGFRAEQPEIIVAYDPVGSGSGRERFAAGAVDFAGSDSAWDRADGSVAGNGVCAPGSGLVQVPLYISPVAVAFNLPGVDRLNLRPEVIAGIFAQTITSWDHPAIVAANPSAPLTSTPITPVFRADDSGTTEVFTGYLAAVAPSAWPYGRAEFAPTALSPEVAQGTSGVVTLLEARPGSIGYADASQVDDLGTVAVGVGDQFVPFSPRAAAALVDASPPAGNRLGERDLAIALDYATAAEGVYPIALVSYSIACERYDDTTVAEQVRSYLEYTASREGQEAAAAEAGSAPISDTLRAEVLAAIATIS